MSRFYYTYNYYPDCSAATEYSRTRTPASIGTGMAGGLFAMAFGLSFINESHSFWESYNWSGLIGSLIIFLCALAFAYYAFVYRYHQTRYDLNIIFIEQEYRKAVVYNDNDISEHIKEKYRKRCDDKKKQATYLFKKAVRKSIIIYSSCALVFILAIIFLSR